MVSQFNHPGTTFGTFGDFMENPDRAVRKEAYEKFYAQFASHANTLAALYAGSVAGDIFQSLVDIHITGCHVEQ